MSEGDVPTVTADADDGDEAGDSDAASDMYQSGAAVAQGIRTAIWVSLRGIGDLILGFVRNLFALPVLSVIGRAFWKGMLARSLHAYHKAGKGDAVGLVRKPSGKIEPTAIKWKTADETDDDERPGWHARAFDHSWKPDTYGRELPRMGKTPVKPLDLDSWRATSFMEARVAEAVDQGDTQPLYRVDEANLTATLDYQGGQAGAVADGGAVVNSIEFDPRGSPVFDDTIINLGSGEYDGHAVSWSKAKELYAERTTTDEMDQQEQRGFLAGRSKQDMKSWMLKILLIGGAIAALGLIGPELIQALFGGGGGSGGVIPV